MNSPYLRACANNNKLTLNPSLTERGTFKKLRKWLVLVLLFLREGVGDEFLN